MEEVPGASAAGEPVLESNVPARANGGWRGRAFALGMALAGGLLGIAGVIVQETRGANNPLIFFVGAPIIEEALKPAGLYILLARWPQLLRSQLFTACLAGLSGLVFGVVESTMYVFVYVPDHSDQFVLFRYTVNVAAHALFSFGFGLGINTKLLDWAHGRGPLPKRNVAAFLTAMAMHSAFNMAAVGLALSGILDFE